MDLKGRNFLKLLDFTPEEILYLIDLAAELKDKKKKGILTKDMHQGKNVAHDGFKIRRSTVEHAIPCLTSMDTARELQRVMSAMRRRRIVSVVALQDLSLSWED